MSRKRYKSDKTTTTLRVKKTKAAEVRKFAKTQKESVFVVTDKLLTDGLAQPKQI